MKIIFLGVGEAFDENEPNTSILVLSDKNLLLDCGYSIPPQLWKYDSSPNLLDAIFVSHPHADHYFGIPALVVRMKEEKRSKSLGIICRKGLKDLISQMISDYAYPNASDDLGFSLKFMEVDDTSQVQVGNLKLLFGYTNHSIPNLAIQLKEDSKTVCYSGDGSLTDATKRLYAGCNLLIHETYQVSKRMFGHGCLSDVIDFAERNNIGTIAPVHICRKVRAHDLGKIKALCEERSQNYILPVPFQEIDL
jgi:ribonuclease Z